MANDPGSILSAHSGQVLLPFPSGAQKESPSAAQAARLKLQFSTRRKKDRIDFSFLMAGARGSDLGRLVIPYPLAPHARARKNELWKSTCLELFIGPANHSSYFELNLSPSGDWNLYAFDSYRAGMREAKQSQAPLFECQWTTDRESVVWNGSLLVGESEKDADLSRLLSSSSLVMGATAVLEYSGGEKEYWAISHAGEKPDFHLRESFRLVL